MAGDVMRSLMTHHKGQFVNIARIFNKANRKDQIWVARIVQGLKRVDACISVTLNRNGEITVLIWCFLAANIFGNGFDLGDHCAEIIHCHIWGQFGQIIAACRACRCARWRGACHLTRG